MNSNDYTAVTSGSVAQMALPICIQRAIDSINEERDKLLSMLQAGADAEDIAAQFPDVLTRPNAYGSGSVWLYAHVKSANELVAIRRALAARGYHAIHEPTDYPHEHRRVYHLDPIILDATFPGGDGATCKYVEVGKKEVPVYELQCDGPSA